MNAIEQLQALDDLTKCRAAVHAKMLKESSRIMQGFRYPGEWDPDRLHTAHELAKSIISLLEPYKNTNDQKAFIIRKLEPLVAMHYQVAR